MPNTVFSQPAYPFPTSLSPASTGQPSSPASAGPSLTNQPPPARLLSPTGLPYPTPTSPTPLPYASPGGNIQGTSGYDMPQARILPILIQRLAGSTDFVSASPLLQFPFVIRSLYLWAPAAAAGGNSDGTIDIRIGSDATLTTTAFLKADGIAYPGANARQIYAASPITFSGLWLPYPEGNQYLLARATSTGAATNLYCVCWAGITPLADIEGA